MSTAAGERKRGAGERLRASALGLLAIAGLAGCSVLPKVDEADLRTLDQGDAPQRLSVLRRLGERVTGVGFTDGNRVGLLKDGAGALPAVDAAIDAARSTIDLETYVFDEDNGLDIAERLIAARGRQVEVNLVYDAWGSLHTPRAALDRLRKAGIHVVEFNPVDARALDVGLANHRDHRKLLIVDRRTVITGGVNISGVYLRSARTPAADNDPQHDSWRDTDIRVEGPAVADYERGFLETWTTHGGAPLAPRPSLERAASGALPVQVITNQPEQKDHDIYRSLLLAISLAHREVHLTTGFFVPTADLRHALRSAARRGVDVRVIVPSNSTSELSVAAGRAYYEDLLEDGVHILEYPADRVLHAKTAVIDGEWSSVGSSNLDWRSIVLNDELTTVVLGAAFAGRLETMFAADSAQAHEVDARTWADRPLGEKLHEWRARLVEYFL